MNILKLTSRYLTAGLFASVLVGAFITKPASAASLTSLLAGGSIVSDGVLFDNFSFTPTALGGAIPVTANAVTVNGIPSGLEFVLPLFAGTNEVNDVALGYRATALGGTLSAVSLSAVGAVGGIGVGSIGETVSNAGPTVLGYVSTFGSGNLSKTIQFTPSSSVTVLKDINTAGDGNGFASISIVDQMFPSNPGPGPAVDVVPEPSEVIGTLFFGILSAGYLVKRKSCNQVG